MSNSNSAVPDLPAAFAGQVPTTAQIFKALGKQHYSYEPERTFVRAIDDPRYIGSASPFKAHRFGPPIELIGNDYRLPFTWVYLGMDPLVAAWESQLVRNNHGPGSGYHITRKADTAGMLASIRFARPLRLWNLGEDHSSRLGFHDIISERNHEACQWFGLQLREAMLMVPPAERPDGFAYPSHRVKGYPALALADWASTGLFGNAAIRLERFRDSDIYARFRDDPMRTDPPERDAR